jgi:hypothetical protein
VGEKGWNEKEQGAKGLMEGRYEQVGKIPILCMLPSSLLNIL